MRATALRAATTVLALVAVVFGAGAGGVEERRAAGAAVTAGRIAAARTAAPAHRQGDRARARGRRTVRASLPRAVRRGDLIVAYVVWSDQRPVRLNDGHGDHFAAAGSRRMSWRHGYSAQVFYARHVRGGRTTVRASFGRRVRRAVLSVDEFSGLDAARPLDGGRARSGTGPTLRAPALRTTRRGDLLYVAAASTGVVTRKSNGFVARSKAFGTLIEDRDVGRPGIYRLGARHRGRTWVIQVVAFRRAVPVGRSCALPRHPNAGCTGVPPGTALAPYRRSCTLSVPNTVVQGKTMTCEVEIRAAGVVIRDSKINGRIILDTDLAGSSAWSLTLVDSEVSAGTPQLAAVSTGNLTVVRANIHGGIYGVQCEEKSVSCTVRDSYIHGQYIQPASDWHIGGFLSDGGQNMKLIHNYVVCDHPQTSIGGGCTGDINFIPNFAPISGALVQDNFFGANVDLAYCTYGGEKPTSYTPHSDHIAYVNNVFQRGTNRSCGAYGPVTNFDVNRPGNSWSGNRWSDGSVVAPAD